MDADTVRANLRSAIDLAKAIASAAPEHPSEVEPRTRPAPDREPSVVSRHMGSGNGQRATDDTAPMAFVSWAHTHVSWDEAQEQDWQSQVANFTLTLRTLGIDAELDLFHMDDADVDWTRFGPKGVRDAEHVLIVVSQAWAERWEGDNPVHEGAGAVAEADELRGLFGRDQGEFQRKCFVIQFPGVPTSAIPNGLSRLPRYRVDVEDPDSYTDLLRALTGQPRFPKPPVGRMPILPPEVLGREVVDRDEALEALRARLRDTQHRESPGTKDDDVMRSSSLRGMIESLLREPPATEGEEPQ